MLSQPLSDDELWWRSIERLDKYPMQQTNPPPEQQQQHLNAAQLAAVNQEVQRVIAGIKMRQWVVEQVLIHTDSEHPTRLARELHAFIVGTAEPEED